MRDYLVYISGPISGDSFHTLEMNVARAVDMFIKLTAQNIPSFCPHLGALFPSCHSLPYEQWMQYDFKMIHHCTHMLMLEGWERSSGARREKSVAEHLGIPVLMTLGGLISVLEAEDVKTS